MAIGSWMHRLGRKVHFTPKVRNQMELMKKCPGSDGFIGEFDHTIKEESISSVSQLFQKIGGTIFKLILRPAMP